MRKFFKPSKWLIPVFFLVPFKTFSQSDWRALARDIVEAYESENELLLIDPFTYLEELVNLISASEASAFHPALLQWVITYQVYTDQLNGGEEVIEKVLSSLEQYPMRQLDFLLSVAPTYRDKANPALKKLSKLIANRDLKDSRWMVEALIAYADNSETGNLDYARSALDLSLTNFGTKSKWYVKSLRAMHWSFEDRGDLKESNEWGQKWHNAQREIEGVNQPILKAFQFRDPAIEIMDGPIDDLILIAELYNLTMPELGGFMTAELYAEALKLLGESDTKRSATLAYHTGLLCLQLEYPELALAYFERAMNGFQALRDTWERALAHQINSHSMYGVALYKMGQFERAIETFEYLKKVTGEKAIMFHNLILTSEKLGNSELIKKYSQEYLAFKGSFVGDEHLERLRKYGQANMILGNRDIGYELMTEAYDEYWALVTFREMEAMEEDPYWDEEFETYGEDNLSLSIGTDVVAYEIRNIPTEETYVPFLKELAFAAFANEDYENARKFTLEYINRYFMNLEWQHQSMNSGTDLGEIYRLKNELFPMYDLFQNIVLKETNASGDDHKRAFNHILDAKSNVQFEYRHMRETVAKTDDPELRQLYDDYLEQRQILSETIASGGDVQGVKSNLNTLRNKLSFKSASFKSPEKHFVFWNEAQEKLGSKDAIVEIKRVPVYDGQRFLSEAVYIAYILKANSTNPELVVFEGWKMMEQQGLARYRNLIKYREVDEVSYGTFWEPLEHHLEGVKTIYLSADGVYNQLNVGSLFNPRSKKFVMEDWDVIQLISSKELITSDGKAKKEIKKAALIGRPAYYVEGFEILETDSLESNERALSRAQITSGTIADLPGTEVEVNNIRKILERTNVEAQVYLHQGASEENFKKLSRDILHIATHGFWFEEKGNSDADAMFNSGLLFAGVKNRVESNSPAYNDGILTAYEIQGLSFDETELAVLSACETALGKVEAGEGVFGLQRALKIAGIDKLIMSLWKVDDQATQELFSAFYTYWLKKGMDIKEAFKKARIEIQEKYRHPYYWGAFVLID